MYENELLIISVYPGMMNDINAVCGSLQINPTILEWEICSGKLAFLMLSSAEAQPQI